MASHTLEPTAPGPRALLRNSCALTLAFVVLGVASGGAQAHRTWLLPNAAHSNGKEVTVVVDAVASEDLFEYEFPLRLETVLILDPRGGVVQPAATVSAKNRNSLEIKLDAAGAYRASNSADTASASYKLGGESKRWRGKPEELAGAIPAQATDITAALQKMRVETFFSKDTASVPFFAVVGHGIEVQPLTPVTDLSDGDSVRFRVYIDGKPAPGAAVALLRGGNRYRYKMGELSLKTDAAGELSFAWPEPGRWWMGVSSDSGPEGGGTVQQPTLRMRYSATFDVLPR